MTNNPETSPTTISVPAIERRDLVEILRSNDLLDRLQQNELQCQACADTLDISTLGAVLVKNTHLLLFCNLADCIEEAMRRSKK